MNATAAMPAFIIGGTGATFAWTEPALAHMCWRKMCYRPQGIGQVTKICKSLMLGVRRVFGTFVVANINLTHYSSFDALLQAWV